MDLRLRYPIKPRVYPCCEAQQDDCPSLRAICMYVYLSYTSPDSVRRRRPRAGTSPATTAAYVNRCRQNGAADGATWLRNIGTRVRGIPGRIRGREEERR